MTRTVAAVVVATIVAVVVMVLVNMVIMLMVGVNTASLGEWPPRCRLPPKPDEVPSGSQRLRVQDQASHLDGGHRLWSGMERDGLRHATLPKPRYMKRNSGTPTPQKFFEQL